MNLKDHCKNLSSLEKKEKGTDAEGGYSDKGWTAKSIFSEVKPR